MLTPQGEVLNWDGGLSPVVHQLDHFLGELEDMVDARGDTSTLTSLFRKKSSGNVNTARIGSSGSSSTSGGGEGREADGKDDRGWQAIKASKCLWGCSDSPVFESTAGGGAG